MLKQMLKHCLAFALICMISTSVMANTSQMKGLFYSSWGQYNSGLEDDPAYLKVLFDAFWNYRQFSPEKKFIGGATIHAKPSGGAPVVDVEKIFAGWNATESFTLYLGEIDPKGAYGFCRGAGAKFGGPLKWFSGASYASGKAFGMHGGLNISENMRIYAGVLSEDKYYAPQPGPAPSLLDADGSGSHFSLAGEAGMFQFRAGYAAGTTRVEDASSDVTNYNSNGMTVSGKLNFGKTVSVAFDYGTKKVGGATSDDDVETTATAFQVRLNKLLGPGNVIVTYGTELIKDADDPTVYSDLVYDAFILDGPANMQAFYVQKDHPAAGPTDERTESYVGLGIWVAY